VNGTGYKLLGLAVWRGGKWYLRKRAPTRRKLVLVGAGGATAAAGAAVLARRLAN
jgi:shikimate 5-dehydrogenase